MRPARAADNSRDHAAFVQRVLQLVAAMPNTTVAQKKARKEARETTLRAYRPPQR